MAPRVSCALYALREERHRSLTARHVPMPVKGPHNRKSLAKATWLATAVRLSNEGHSIRSIATRVSKSTTTVWSALQAEFERVRPQTEELEALRNVQRGQIHRQLQAWIPRSLKGDHHAALSVVRFLDRAAKLDGLDAPTKAEHTGKDGGPIMTVDIDTLSEQQLEAFARGGYAALAGASSAGATPPQEGGDGTEGSG